MSVVKIIELSAEGNSIEAAVEEGLQEASKTIKHIKQLNIEHITVIIDNNKISKYRVNLKISFIVEND